MSFSNFKPTAVAAALLMTLAMTGVAIAATAKDKPAKKQQKAQKFRETLVTATMLPGTHVTAEIPALPLPGGQVLTGTGVTRTIPMTGSITGALAHRFRIGDDIHVNWRKAEFKLGSQDLLSDPACNGAPTLRLNPASVVTIDKSKKSTAVLRYSGVSNADASVMLRLAFDMRTEAGCDKPLVSTGYALTPFTDKLRGKVGPRGLVELALDSKPETFTINVCLYPGPPDKPCRGGLAGYPVKITVHVVVKISLKAGKFVTLKETPRSVRRSPAAR